MLDCIIRGGTVVDGTGAPRFSGDVGIRAGRIEAVGKMQDSAQRIIDAEGMVVAPGFVDVHTHYDAQVMWDPALTPSSLHGVTTVIGGNCGFTIAPVDDQSSDYVTHMLACVEGMPPASLETALDYRWRSFGEWLDRLEGRVALNTGFLVGHSTVRRLVMGEHCREPASASMVDAMAGHVEASLRSGALGFSSSWGETHGDHLGHPVPSRFADADELVALAGLLKKHPGTQLAFIPTITPRFPDRVIETMARMSAAAQRSLNWNSIIVGLGAEPDAIMARLDASDRAAQLGGRVFGLAFPLPVRLRMNLLTATNYNSMPVWHEVLTRPLEQRIAGLSDAETRRAMAADIGDQAGRLALSFPTMTIESVADPKLKSLEGRRVGELAAERGCTPLEVFLDVSVADRLEACFRTLPCGNDEESWKLRARLWNDRRTLVGGSDAGAHVDALDAFGFFTDFIGPVVRDRKLLSLEEAVHRVSDQPARFLGLRGRGRIAPGYCADLVVFDPATVKTGRSQIRDDFPGGEKRLYAGAEGIDRVMVGGVDVAVGGRVTGDTPGTVLRGGRDTGAAEFNT